MVSWRIAAAAGMLALAGFPAAAAAQVSARAHGGAECQRAAESETVTDTYICTRALRRAATDADRATDHINRSIILLRRGELEAALEDCDTALGLVPGLPEGLANRGVALFELRRFSEALDALNAAIDGGVRLPEIVYYDRALAKERLGDVRGAYFDLRAALDLDPDFPQAQRRIKRYKVREVPFNPA